MLRPCALVTLAAISTLASPALAATCDGYAVEAVQDGAEQYDPAAAAGPVVAIRITPSSNPDSACRQVSVELESLAGGPIAIKQGGTQLAVDLYSSSQTAELSLNGAKLSGNARNQLIAGGALVPLFAIKPGQFVSAGVYQASLLVRVGKATPIPVAIQVVVGTSIRFLPENGSSSETISFGEVSQGAVRSSTIYYVANGPFAISAHSENRGNLLHEQGATFGQIPYEAHYDAQLLDLSSGVATIQRTPGSSGAQMDQLVITIRPQTEKYAGHYTDVLTLEFNAY